MSEQSAKHLHIVVSTFDPTGKPAGERIVDLYHPGTRTWLQNHQWWAMHHNHSVETSVATQKEVDQYLAYKSKALAEKFNKAA